MKPANALKKADFFVSDCPQQDAKELIEKYHYAKGTSKVRVYTHGLYEKSTGDLVGAAWWLPPTRVACESVNKEQWKKVLSLSRLVVLPHVPTNGASFLVGQSIRLIKKEGRFVSLVSYADSSQGHEGAIYKATNWDYVGVTRKTPLWVCPASGKQVACKSTVNRTKQQMLDLGYELKGRYEKHKYVMHLTK